MNKKQKECLYKYAQQLERMESEFSFIMEEIEEMRSEEETKLDNLPDSLRESSKGEEIEAAIERLDDVLSALEDKEFSEAADLLNEF